MHAKDQRATCAWCGRELADRSRALYGRLECLRCGAQMTDPWPTDAQLERAYGGWYRPQEGRFSGPLDAILRHSRGRLATSIDRTAPPGPVLDVGAGDGALLDALGAVGRAATGLERVSTRADVIEGEITEAEGSYAAIVFWHSLEHLREPGEALAHAATLLSPGGLLIVAVPNVGSVQAEIAGDRWLALDMPRHLTHLPRPTLLDGVRERELEVVRVSGWRGGQVLFGALHALVARLPGHPDLYDAIRRPQARSRPMGRGLRLGALAAAVVALPAAALLAGAEILLDRGGTTYIEARRSQRRQAAPAP